LSAYTPTLSHSANRLPVSLASRVDCVDLALSFFSGNLDSKRGPLGVRFDCLTFARSRQLAGSRDDVPAPSKPSPPRRAKPIKAIKSTHFISFHFALLDQSLPLPFRLHFVFHNPQWLTF